MVLRPEEVTTIIKREIEGFTEELKMEGTGVVLQVGDGVARIYGLDDCMASELLEFPHEVYGIALNLEENNIGAILLGADEKIKEGDTVKTTGKVIQVP
ncbi:MAG: F0F1 ATP synthase subunit alpha, partial [bacterium]